MCGEGPIAPAGGWRYVFLVAVEQDSSLVAILDDDESVQSALQDLVEPERMCALCFGSAEQILDSKSPTQGLMPDCRHSHARHVWSRTANKP